MSILSIIIAHLSSLGQMDIGMRMRVACSSLLYRKVGKQKKLFQPANRILQYLS